jgi:HEAT repeat protein
MPIPAAVIAILQSVAGTLISKAPLAVQEKLSAKKSLENDLESAWSGARQAILDEKIPFDAFIRQEELSEVVFKHALDPYWLISPDENEIQLAVRTHWLEDTRAGQAAGRFVEHFVTAWKHTGSFATCAQSFEQIKGNDLLREIHVAIENLSAKDFSFKAASIPPPEESLLIEYCRRLAIRPAAQPVATRSVTEKPLSKATGAPPKPFPLEQAFADHRRMVLLGEGGLGKTMALRQRELTLAAKYAAGGGSPAPVYVRLADYDGGDIEALLAVQVNRALTGSGLRLSQTDEESVRALRAWLDAQPDRVEILLDGLNEVPETYAAKFRPSLDAFLGHPQRVIFTSRDQYADPLPGQLIPEFLLQPLQPAEVNDLLSKRLGSQSAPVLVRLSSDEKLAALCRNPFMLELVTGLVQSGSGTLPENRALLIRASVAEAVRALRAEGKLTGAAARSGVVEEFLAALGWKMLRAGRVSARYSSVEPWNLRPPGSRFDLEAVLSAASALRHLASAGNQSAPVEFRHPLLRDYFGAERIAALLEEGNDLDVATDKQYNAPDWSEAVKMAAGLRGPKSADLVQWLAAQGCLDLAFDCWAESEARNQPAATAQLAAALRARVNPSNIEYADGIVIHLGVLRDPLAVPLIVEFLERHASGAHYEAIPALEQIRSDDALAALVAALEKDEETKREAADALRRIGMDSVPALLRSSSGAAETLLYELARTAVAPLTHALNDSDVGVRARAVRALGKSGDQKSARRISELLDTDQTRVRVEAPRALNQLGDLLAIPALLRALNPGTAAGATSPEASPESDAAANNAVRFEAALALWERNWEPAAARAVLLELYESMGIYDWRKADILEALMLRPDQQIFDLVLAACEDGNDRVRRTALQLLEHVPGSIDHLLVKGLLDSVRSVQSIAAACLLERHGEGAMRWIRQAFEESPSGQEHILDLIDHRYGEGGRKFLVQVLESGSSEAVRATAAKSLSQFQHPDVATALRKVLLNTDPAREPWLTSEVIWSLQGSTDPAVSGRVRRLAEDSTIDEKLRERARYILHRQRKRADA